ncbi:MAG: hypothetical protein Q8O03_07550 [Nanoarchaeota archaeon]|nr:hypothetical protein [Nanoarchaeota archaeon]
MKYITNVRFRLPRYEQSEKIKKDLEDFLEIFKMAYGGIKLEWYHSKLPMTILGSIKDSVKTTKERSNHVVVKWGQTRLMEFYYGPSKLLGYRLNGYFYDKIIRGISWDEPRKITRMIERYNMKVYNIPLLEYGVVPAIIIGILIILLIIQLIRAF